MRINLFDNIIVKLAFFAFIFLCMVGIMQLILPYNLIYIGFDLFLSSLLSIIIYNLIFKINKYYHLIYKINKIIINTIILLIILLVIFKSLVFILLNNYYNVITINNFNAYFLLFLLPTLFQAFSEEIIFRSIILLELKKKFGNTVSIMISSILFATIHILNPSFSFFAFLNTFLAGILFAQMVIYSNSLIPSIIFHTLWNYIIAYIFGINLSGYGTELSFFSINYKKLPPELFGGNYGIEASILTTLFLILSIFIYYNINQKLSFRR